MGIFKPGYNAVNAKIGSLKKGLLTQSDYENIIALKTREDIIEYLKNNPLYKYTIEENKDYVFLHRYATEFVIKKSEVDILERLRNFIHSSEQKFIDIVLSGYEEDDIKLILRSIEEKDPIYLEKETFMYNHKTYIDYKELLKCENLSKALDMLKNTPLRHAIVGVKDDSDLKMRFHVEMNLDINFFKSLKEISKKHGKKSRKILAKFFKELIFIINIQCIIRAKKYYNISNEEIFNYTIKWGSLFRSGVLKEIIYTDNYDDILKKIKESKYKYIIENLDFDTLTYDDIIAYLYKKQLKNLNQYQDTIVTFLKFIIELRIQNKNLTRIAECKKYRFSQVDTEKFLIKI